MIENLKSFLPAVLLVAIGWLLNFITMKVTFKQTRELEKKKILREKIEELAKLVYKIKDIYRNISMKIIVNAVTNGEIKDMSENVLPFPLIRVLIDFYFPELKAEYNELADKKKEFGDQVVTFLKEKGQTRRKEIAGKIYSESDEIDEICEKIISSSSKIAQKLL